MAGARPRRAHGAVPPDHLRPMLATLGKQPPKGDGWAWELKWDGIRALTFLTSDAGPALRIFTRNGNNVTHRYPELRGLSSDVAGNTVLDGEIVTLDERGRPSFERLQQRMHVEDVGAIRRFVTEVPVLYMIFDVLWLDGESMLARPYEERRAALVSLDLHGGSWQVPPNEVGDGHATQDVSRQFGLEGVVAKQLSSRYEPGRRSPAWVKVKHRMEQEFVVGGWQPGEGGRTGSIGSLLIGYYQDGVLHYAARVGSGLSQAEIARYERRFAELARATSPFDVGGPPKAARWVEPEVVVQVRFTEWTSVGGVRHPIYVGTRDDKSPREVVRETPA